VQGQLTVPEISSFSIILPDSLILKRYQEKVCIFSKHIELIKLQTKKIEKLQSVLLSKLATIGD
jgi:hypothetical protein